VAAMERMARGGGGEGGGPTKDPPQRREATEGRETVGVPEVMQRSPRRERRRPRQVREALYPDPRREGHMRADAEGGGAGPTQPRCRFDAVGARRWGGAA
jgi:hypothetical protein